MKAIVKTKNSKAVAIAPSGTSVSKYEAIAFPRDIDLLIKRAEKTLIPKLIGVEVTDQEKIDSIIRKVDDTNNFSAIGGNIAIAISAACLKAAAKSKKKELYKYLAKESNPSIPLMINKMIGGGKHAENSTEIQEFLAIPLTSSIKKAFKISKELHARIGKKIGSKKLDYEGGWVAEIPNEIALKILNEEAEKLSRKRKIEIAIGVDFAASSFYNGKKYVYKDKELSTMQQRRYVAELIEEYDLYYIEDPFHEDDFKSFKWLAEKFPDRLICGDDLFATNEKRFEKGIKLKAANSIIIKPNQAGTITQTLNVVKKAFENQYTPIISHRSGETMDDLISDLAVGLNIPYMKIGIIGKERVIKIKRLMKIQKVIKHEKKKRERRIFKARS